MAMVAANDPATTPEQGKQCQPGRLRSRSSAAEISPTKPNRTSTATVLPRAKTVGLIAAATGVGAAPVLAEAAAGGPEVEGVDAADAPAAVGAEADRAVKLTSAIIGLR